MEPVLPFELRLDGVRPGGLTLALHRQLRAAILEQRLPSGYALPSTRRLAAALGLGRNTVITAYDLLQAEGHAQSRPGGRSIVTGPRAIAAQAAPVASKRASEARLGPAWRQPVQRIGHDAPLPARSFRTGVPEHRFFDHETWRRLSGRALRRAADLPFAYGPPQGLPALREAIAGHVAFVRAVRCEPDDVLVSSGAQQAFDLLARLLVSPERRCVAVEDPGYAPMRAAFTAAGACVLPVPVDEQGLRVDRLPTEARIVCVTPSHQSPTGAVMSAARRAALLAWAGARDAVVIEDDYDGEFLFEPHAQDALQTLDRDARVFYVGTFSKSLFPALRKGFVVAPAWAREALVDLKRCADSHSDVIGQRVLADFIAEGHLARHIRRMRPIYAQRRQALERALQAQLADWMTVMPGAAGLHLSVRFTRPAQASRIVAAARIHLPGALPLSAHALGKLVQPGLCIGYGSVEVDQIVKAVRALARALRS